MIAPYPENVARLDADWDRDLGAKCPEVAEQPDPVERRLEALEAAEGQRRRDAAVDARCRRLGLVIARRMPARHQHR